MTTTQARNAPAPTGVETRVLCVDLDGTLIRTDLLVESVFALLKRNILFLFMLPLWLLKGRARLKHEIARRVDVDAALLPYHADFLAYLKSAHAGGRRLALVTASPAKYAHAVAQHLNLFQEVLASTESENLSGRRKRDRLQSLFGEDGFDYAGNAMIDFVLWDKAGQRLLVNPERGVRKRAERRFDSIRVFDDRSGNPLQRYLKALRLHQWLKNLLLFVPLMTAHRYGEPALIGQAVLAFLAFGLCASSVYLLNDLFDLPDDRRHPSKRLRPFAAGSVSIVNGTMLIPALLIAAFVIAAFLPIAFVGTLAVYYLLTLAYSLLLKRAAVIDVLTLASLYTLRLIAGAAAISVVASFWLLAFSMFLFLSLALVKRYTELLTLRQNDETGPSGRGYRTSDLETLSQFGGVSGYASVLVLALYINSEAVRTLYAHPKVIWLLCPLLLYMITRIWLLARRDEMHDDPVIFVIHDRSSQCVALLAAILLWLAV